MKYFRNALNAIFNPSKPKSGLLGASTRRELRPSTPTRQNRACRGPRCYAGVLLTLVVVSGAWAVTEFELAESGSAIEAALYRWMPMPVSKALGLRPPGEATPLLSELINRQPTAELYSLRALNEESALDFAAAETDWKKYTELSSDRTQAQLALADFYHRRLRPADEIAVLAMVGSAPAAAGEKLTRVEQQRSWLAFERIFKIIGENNLPVEVSDRHYRAWLDRYPGSPGLYNRYFQFLLDHKLFAEAEKLVARYHAAHPADEIFPVKARALLAYKQGSIQQGLAVYDTQFQPLWPQELVDSYFALMQETRSQRRFLDLARAGLERNSNDLNSAARIFYFYQRQGRTDAAQQTLAQYRARKEQQNQKWSSQELYTLARLHEGIKNYPEAARYYYALYNTSDRADAPELALAGLIHVLLDAPEQSIRVGSGELSMYRDIASMDTGPGYLNGILSLVLNTTSPNYAYSEEEQRAVPYFHRAEAAELTRIFDGRFPNSRLRGGLRAGLIETYSAYGESAAVIREGKQFLSAFPAAPDREHVAMLLADAYARENRTAEEFALYDAELAELARKSDGVPLGMKTGAEDPPSDAVASEPVENEGGSEAGSESAETQIKRTQPSRAFSAQAVASTEGAKTPQGWYSDFLERYLSRLASMQQIPQALAVLRKEVDRNPNDPGLYERLAQFLEQNQLGQQQEQVYERAIKQFPDRSWYHKLARFYLRQQRHADFLRLSEQVTKIFSGTELEKYFTNVVNGAQYYTRLNEFAHARFPHDLLFVRNLLGSYSSPPTQMAKWEELLRQHWWEAEDLRNQYFEYLSRTGRLDQELAALRELETAAAAGHWSDLAKGNPVAARFVGESALWRSHFEEGAPVMGALAELYPADVELGRRTSAVFRSLAAFNPRDTEVAVKIEENLYHSDPGNRETLARIGDILADRELFERAAPYWNRMPQIRPGEPQAYLDTATIYWDYYDFDTALKWLDEGRARLGKRSLYAYEAGAIYESKHEYAQAVAEYVTGALEEEAGSKPYNRLLDLARRKTLRDEVDHATEKLTESATPEIKAIQLRVAVLEAQNRAKDVERLFTTLGERSNSLDMLEWLEETARQKSLTAVQEKVLEKQAALTSDPIRKLELRYSLVRFYESKKDVPQAQRSIDALYRENPKILGVVRSTVDFYWQHKDRARAIAVLLQAMNDSYPALATQFRFEAARKACEAGQYEQSRKLLAQLLSASPYDGSYLAAMADTYANEGDDAGLKKFYLEKIEEFRKAQLPQDVRTRQIATLRRGLIPALTRMKDYAGAVDQYIEIINRFPEDDALISEAALYAQRRGRQQQLLGYYANTVKQSPKDYRWPVVLAKMQAQVEDYPAAVETYATAIKIRPDRVDLRTARAELLERLMRLDEAVAEYKLLFDLNYHDPRWMEKVAEISARQGKTAETVAALHTALIEGRSEKASNFFEVAKRLQGWGMLQPAREYAQKGVDAAGRDLLAVSENADGANLYAAIMTRLRQQETAYARLLKGVEDANSLGAAVAVATGQIEKNGLAAVTDQQWRDRALAARKATARADMQGGMESMGKTVNRYFTPEEKLQFALWLDRQALQSGDAQLAGVFLPAATAAELPDQQARWLKRLMLNNYSPNRGRYKSQLAELETRRMHYQELGQALEAYAQTVVPAAREAVLVEAANAYRAGAHYDAELLVLRRIAGPVGGEMQQRYFQLLLERQPELLLQAATSDDAAAQYAIAHGSSSLAQQAITARGRGLPPVWSNAYAGLTGLYFSDRSPLVNTAFRNALGDSAIGERLGKPVDRERQLAGNVWFYYGSRHGEWLGISRAGDPDDFLPALLEQSPATASGYATLGEYYMQNGKIDRAIDDYNRTLELAPARADIHDRVAVLYWRQLKRDLAMAEWKQALELLNAQVHQRVVPPSFWPTFGYVLNHIGYRHLTTELQPQWESVLRDYIRQNGTYQSQDLMRAAYLAIGDPQAGVSLLLELASISPEPGSMLKEMTGFEWIPKPARTPIYEQLIASLTDRVRTAEGISRQYAEEELRSWQTSYARHLVELKEYDRAAAVMQPQERRNSSELELRYRIALANGQFDAIIEDYRANPEKTPDRKELRQAAEALQRAGLRPAARKILELLFTEEIAAHQLSTANLLGLAEIRLQDGDTAGAMELLRRLVLVVGRPFENLEPAADLLARNGHHSEAVEFLGQLVKAEPWNQNARLRLAQELIAAAQDAGAARALAAAVAGDSGAAYADRLTAAAMLSGSSPSLGSRELDFLAYGTGGADEPYFYAARLSAAHKAPPEAAARLLQNAVADAPAKEAARVPLFYALVALKQDRLAISSLAPLLDRGYLSGYYHRYRREDDSLSDPEESNADAGDSATEASESPVRKEANAADRAALAAAVAKSYANLGELKTALTYYRTARDLQAGKAEHAELNGKISGLQTTIRRNRENERRMPKIHPALEQDRTVRPRLVAAAPKAPPPKAAPNRKGGSAR